METLSDRAGSVISAADVVVQINEAEILHGLSFEVGPSRLVGLVGPNGSGKTTLLRAVSGLIPFRGEIMFCGRSIRDWKAKRLARELAFVRQSVSLSFDFAVSELVLMGRSPHKRWLEDYGQDDRSLMQAALRHVDLDGFQDRSIMSLSGGELQRVFLAQALVQEAGVLLLDEPTAHLDVHYQFEFMDLIAGLVEKGRTVVAVFHDLEMAARYAHEVFVLSDGRIAAAGSPEDVLTRSLIANVFRMEADVGTNVDGHLRIEYHAPIHRLEPANT